MNDHGTPALGRRAALGLGLAAPVVGATAPPAHAASGPRPVRGLKAVGEIGRVELSWDGRPYEPLVDHYAIYASRTAGFEIGPETLLGKTVYTTFKHDRLGGAAREWHYRVVVVDAAGERSRPSARVTGRSEESVAVSGRPIATIGAFDHKSLELALAPAGYAQVPKRFANGADYTHGIHQPAVDWPYIHPGPADGWGGRKPYRYTFRFDVEQVPAGEPWLSIWLVDTHASLAGEIVLALNDTALGTVKLENGGTRGSLEGDATVPGTALKPSYVELALPRAAVIAGRNVLTIDKNIGSWHVYDALGVFERR
ncbi:polysaccharide lyase family protein [Thermomonospora umbrina]|uniref:Polysaccharide lyase family 4-like protein n=1 Tax=Thermomonospora umbrina TaxID=111806 RepID=A0A3D9T3I7_9ACTN|nr:polysaccharide lyase family protein [Thermomonospora umbrina]REE99815.1 polysaccharide lyase family 4-like protein [Thermomonospora umbrina]